MLLPWWFILLDLLPVYPDLIVRLREDLEYSTTGDDNGSQLLRVVYVGRHVSLEAAIFSVPITQIVRQSNSGERSINMTSSFNRDYSAYSMRLLLCNYVRSFVREEASNNYPAVSSGFLHSVSQTFCLMQTSMSWTVYGPGTVYSAPSLHKFIQLARLSA